MEKDNRRKHPDDIAETDHRIRHAKGEMLDDVHPQDRGEAITEATAGKLPIREQPDEIVGRPGKGPYFG